MNGRNQNQRNGNKIIILGRGNKPNIQNRLRKYKPNNQTGNGDNNGFPRNKQQLIAKNLSMLKENIRKKQMAQKLYYQSNGNKNTSNQSPLTRPNPQLKKNNKFANNDKASVHKRLGKRNTNNVNNTNKITILRQNKTQKIIHLQRKMNRGHQQQQQHQQQSHMTNSYLQNNINQGKQKKIILRRSRPQTAGPMNYTVQVKNNTLTTSPPTKHHTELNPRLQAEIKLIQKTNHVHEIVPAMPLHPPGSGTTKTTLNERFSHL